MGEKERGRWREKVNEISSEELRGNSANCNEQEEREKNDIECNLRIEAPLTTVGDYLHESLWILVNITRCWFENALTRLAITPSHSRFLSAYLHIDRTESNLRVSYWHSSDFRVGFFFFFIRLVRVMRRCHSNTLTRMWLKSRSTCSLDTSVINIYLGRCLMIILDDARLIRK